MVAQVSPIAEQIKERLRLLVPKLEGRIYDGNVPEGEKIPVDGQGRIRPYVILNFGGAFRTGRRMRGITSSRDNLRFTNMMALVHAATVNQTMEISDDVRDALEGFEPIGGSEIYEETSGTARKPADATLKPVRYVDMLLFTLLINT